MAINNINCETWEGNFNYFFNYIVEQISDILYYEVLDIPLPELQGLKTLKVAFRHATKDEVSILIIYFKLQIIPLRFC